MRTSRLLLDTLISDVSSMKPGSLDDKRREIDTALLTIIATALVEISERREP